MLILKDYVTILPVCTTVVFCVGGKYALLFMVAFSYKDNKI